MVAITRPEAFGAPHVALVLRYGFSHRCRDALLTRHACATLQRLAESLRATG